MEIITIKNNEYILVENIFNKAPVYYKESRNGRELIKNKKITDYIYAKIKDGVWIQSDGKSYKYDKILLKKEFVDTIKEINEPEKISEESKYEIAPDIILLENSEKFKNTNGTIIDIETRGKRNVNNIYFKVKDVMFGFGIEHLHDTIIHKNKCYNENEHYKYFNCKKIKNLGKIKIKKELFLTYNGLLKVINTCRKKFNTDNIYIFNKWLNNLDNNILNEYNIEINTKKNNSGYIYFVTSDVLNAVKIGMWKSNLSSLYNRYITVYGKNIKIEYFYSENIRLVEKHIHTILIYIELLMNYLIKIF